MTNRSHHAVAYSGTRAATAGLTWAQQVIFRAVQARDSDTGHTYNMCRVVPVLGGAGTADVLAALAALVSAYEPLHTRFVDGAGGPRQVVTRHGVLDVDVVETAEDGAEQEVDRLVRELGDRPFDLAADDPVRASVVVVGGGPRWIVLAVSHVAVDGGGFRALRRRLADLVAGGPAPMDGPGRQPVDRAAEEASGRGRAESARALHYWERHLRIVPQTMVAWASDGEDPVFAEGRIHSVALELAARELGARCGVNAATVYLAAVATLLGRMNGTSRTWLQMITANRWSPSDREHVGVLAQDALFSAELAGVAFAESVVRAWTASQRGHRYGRYDPAALRALADSVGRDRGACLDPTVFLNNHRLFDTVPPAAGSGIAASLETSRTSTRMSWLPGRNPRGVKLFFAVQQAQEAAVIDLLADTRYLSEPAIHGFLTAVEELVVSACLDGSDVAPSLPVADRPGRWVPIDGCWVEVAAVEALLEDSALVGCSRVFVTRHDGRQELVAAAVPCDASLTAPVLHARLLDRLCTRPTAMAPHRYVLTPVAPERPGELDRWRQLSGAREWVSSEDVDA